MTCHISRGQRLLLSTLLEKEVKGKEKMEERIYSPLNESQYIKNTLTQENILRSLTKRNLVLTSLQNYCTESFV